MTKIFVGNLPYTATESDIRFLFSPFGKVSSVDIKTDMATQKPRGFAFVSMPSYEDADEAICRLSHASLNGRHLTINEAQARNETNIKSGEARNRALAMFDALQVTETT